MRITRPSTLPLLAHLTVAWGLLFALVHFYWAVEGAGSGADTPAAQAYIAFIAVLGLLGSAVAHGVAHDWGARLGSRRLTLLARSGGAVLLLGAAFGIGTWFADGSLNGDGTEGVAITAYFLLGGALFSAVGWRRAPSRSPRGPKPSI